MNQQSKRAIKSLVLDLRHKLEDDIAIQLKRYGFAGERWLPLDRLAHIQQDDQATIDHYRLKAALEQELRRMGVDPDKATAKQRAEAVDWFVREVAFTYLNRLVALKCLEVRDLIPEIITTRDEARGADDALPAAIRHVCRRVHAEFKLLFDVGDPASSRHPPANSVLWPSHPVLKECIALINGLDEAAGISHRFVLSPDPIILSIRVLPDDGVKEAVEAVSGAGHGSCSSDACRQAAGLAGYDDEPGLESGSQVHGTLDC